MQNHRKKSCMPIRLALPLLLAMLCGAATADIYKCRLPDGSTEIANRPCPSGAGTLASRPDDVIPEARRREAERDAERMRALVEQRETQQRTGAAPSPQGGVLPLPHENQKAAGRRSVDDCLRELDRHPLDVQQRSQLENACRNNPDIQPVIVQTPVAVVPQVVPSSGVIGSPLGQCIQNIVNLNLPPAEKQLRIRQCEATYAQPGTPTAQAPNYLQPALVRPVPKPEPKPEPKPGSGTRNSVCLPGSKFCGQ